MSAASPAHQTKIFGLKLTVNPKLIVGGLLALALVLFLITRGTDNPSSNTAVNAPSVAVPENGGAVPARRGRTRRTRRAAVSTRDALRIQPVDAAQGDIDPTLRLDMLKRVQNTNVSAPGRSLFELAPQSAPTNAQIAAVNQHILPKPIAPQTGPAEIAAAGPPPIVVPFKYYGFAKGVSKASKRRGLFLEGDNVIVASEGDLIDHHFLIVSLTPAKADVEDTSQKRGTSVDVTPEAIDK